MSQFTQIPRTDLPPLRHQQVRGLLVREARPATGRRVSRRVVPALAGLSVLGLGGLVAMPTTGLGAALGSAVGISQNPCPPTGNVGYSPEYRQPKASDDAAGVRFLPPGTPTSVVYRMGSYCALPERADRPVLRPDAVWTLARTGPDGVIDAVVTLYRGLPEGISPQVADRTSRRLPTDGNDAGTVLDPPFRAIDVRGTTGTLAEQPGRNVDQTVSLVWTEPKPDRAQWGLQAHGLTSSELVAVAGRLRIEGDTVEPGEQRVFRSSPAAVGGRTTPFWHRFDVPPTLPVEVGEVSWSAYLAAVLPGRTATSEVLVEVVAPHPDWRGLDARLVLRPGDQILVVAGRRAVLNRAYAELQFDLPSGALVKLLLMGGTTLEPTASTPGSRPTAQDVDELLAAAAALTAVPADDPRLAQARLDH